VGQDAALEKNYAALSSIAADGHEIGNHSFHHEPWLHLYTELQVEREIAQTEEHNAGAKDLIISAGGHKWWGYTAYYLQARVENLDECFRRMDYPGVWQDIQAQIQLTRASGGRVFVMQDALEPELCYAPVAGWDLALYASFRHDIMPRLDCFQSDDISICEVVR
jgi:peptidoglycan/xylan/chitin deacetylase (PgdA/CDA1 family)